MKLTKKNCGEIVSIDEVKSPTVRQRNVSYTR